MKREIPHAVYADASGKVFHSPHIQAAGMERGSFSALEPGHLIRLPPTSQLFTLPMRNPIGYDARSGRFVCMSHERYSAVGAHMAPGNTVTLSPAYRERGTPQRLPLFSYTALAFYKGNYYTAGITVDRDRRHDARYIDIPSVKKGIAATRKLLPMNRLITHLERCALRYGCPNAQNFFLSRYEAPLPVSPYCNAQCAGCISYQARKNCQPSQPRIRFVPTPQEIAEIALFHLRRAQDPIVSFGQGCEGEPLLRTHTIERAIAMIRKATTRGVIHVNTNASRPDALQELIDAGLDSIRISLNSARPAYYNRYYKPRGYAFRDVMKSIRICRSRRIFVSLNYLTMPGFTDTADELAALTGFLARSGVDMIQWRNLNYDPIAFIRDMKLPKPALQDIIGLGRMIRTLKRRFPRLAMGYFNPSKRKMARICGNRP